MREPRVKLQNVEAFYYISNEIREELPDLIRKEQNILLKQIISVAKLCRIKILAYTIYSRGYTLIIRIPAPTKVSDNSLAKSITECLGAKKRRSFQKSIKNTNNSRVCHPQQEI